jgi:hypothetical protein
MEPNIFGVKPGEHVSGEVMHEYIGRYADKFGIIDAVRCGVRVVSATRCEEGGWDLAVEDANAAATAKLQFIHAKKLVVATGLTSEPNIPTLPGQEHFDAPLFHGKYLPKHTELLDKAKRVTVYGGAKMAYDAVYEFASHGVEVDWVIRGSPPFCRPEPEISADKWHDTETGRGPMWMSPPYVTPLNKWLEKLVMTRLLTFFSPCIWGEADGYSWARGFLHGTFVGRAIVNAFWWILGNDVLALNNYDAHPQTKKLKPWSQPMFVGSSFSIMNYPTDFFELVRRGGVHVHIADIERLSHHTVHLSDGTELRTDALCCVTGWKVVPPLKFLPEGIDVDLGLPHDPAAKPILPKEEALWTVDSIANIDAGILNRFPRLRDQPTKSKAMAKEEETTPFTLYRFIVPPSSSLMQRRDIAFAGLVMNFEVLIMAEVQALWIAAYFGGVQLGDIAAASVDCVAKDGERNAAAMARIRRDTLLHTRFGRWRYPAGYGRRYPDFVFDAMPYLDLLLRELGLRRWRKKGMLAELLEPYGPEDYRNLVAEFREKCER